MTAARAVTTMLLISLVVGATFTVARETITAFIGKYVFIAINEHLTQHTKTHILFNLCSCPAGGHFSPPLRLLRKTRAMGSVRRLRRRDGGGFKLSKKPGKTPRLLKSINLLTYYIYSFFNRYGLCKIAVCVLCRNGQITPAAGNHIIRYIGGRVL